MVWALLFITVALFAQTIPNAELVNAAEAGDLKRVRELLDAGADPNSPKSFSAFEAACAASLPDVVEVMLEHRADVKQRDSAGRTPLNVLGQTEVEGVHVEPDGRHVVVRRGNSAEVARRLMRAGADVNAQEDTYHNTPLHDSPDAATAQVLIDAGAKINQQNVEGRTPLMLTLDPEVTRVLLRAGADTTVRDYRGRNALDLAREFELTEKIALLTKR
jgi:ankyrin repeat protein